MDRLRELELVIHGLRDEMRRGAIRQHDEWGWKETAGIPLLVATFELTVSMVALIRADPHCGWVAAHTLHRPQMEYFTRALYFLGPASLGEAERFCKSGRLPKRTVERNGRKRKVDITRDQMAREVAQSFDMGNFFEETYSTTYGPNSSLIHGGAELVALYWHDGEFGPAKVSGDDIIGSLHNPLALALDVCTRLPALGLDAMNSDVVRGLLTRGAALADLTRALLCGDHSEPQADRA